jgi:hypothetical protein
MATGDPKTGRRPVERAEHHLTRGRHNICVYYFFVFDAHWGRASVRIASYLPFEVTLQLNGHDYLERQLHRQRRAITMAANAVAHVADWPALRTLAATDREPAVRRFGAYWLARLPHSLTAPQLALLGGYYRCSRSATTLSFAPPTSAAPSSRPCSSTISCSAAPTPSAICSA